ncbi:acyl-CoA dehydrogenase family protein [Parahaliea mediterranea]|uniref:Acyl-CoA dehydrogenase family protein n=1 Tax=Parahaliea mediterranea TaxID=651086 RepID=A0A939DIH9_9GAMM|nr:acyl-CoA dehydrogenase family protein [Parahaliea mediterranea]MBN7798628.1 acyl-CoA dehydrogenase family protein [Parahaliea mediterranea]
MALVLNEEQVMLKDSAAGFLAQKAGVPQLRALRDGNSAEGFDPAVWREMVDMGWAGIAIPEDFGGLGYGYTGFGLVLEQVGRHLSCSPLESSVLVAATLVNELGSPAQKARWLPAIAGGDCQMTLALQEGSHHAPERTAATARAEGDGFVLNGDKVLVLDAATAGHFLVVARTAGEAGDTEGLGVFLVAAGTEGLSVEPRSMVDSRSAGALALRDVRVDADAVLGEPGAAWAALERTLDIANIGLAAELLGLSVEAFERTVAYLQERKQFGRIIGGFQGLQHRAAELFAELELARSTVLKALQAIDGDADKLSLLASAAKAKLCEVAARATNEAIQMHGGIGMTDEHEIGFFIKRARVVQHTFGDYNYHLDRFARLSGF